jgi:hypothetical protein
MLCISSAY